MPVKTFKSFSEVSFPNFKRSSRNRYPTESLLESPTKIFNKLDGVSPWVKNPPSLCLLPPFFKIPPSNFCCHIFWTNNILFFSFYKHKQEQETIFQGFLALTAWRGSNSQVLNKDHDTYLVLANMPGKLTMP